MFSAIDLSCRLGTRELFKDINFTINPGDKIGLIGPNGAGKTTLLRIMAGDIEPDSGRFIMPKGAVTAYLPQELDKDLNACTVWEEVERAFMEVRSWEAELDLVHGRLSAMGENDCRKHEQLLEYRENLLHSLERHDSYTIDARIRQVLSGLGFSQDDFHRPLAEFSGGWIMRSSLARLLLTYPALLLLDEPTNHLDLDSVTWLEQWLGQQNCSLVLVSHDQAFLDQTVRRIFELDGGRLRIFTGNFSRYLVEKEKQAQQEETHYRNTRARARQIEKFVERFRAKATKARQVQSRIKMLEKMDLSVPDAGTASGIKFRFPDPVRSGRNVVTADGVSRLFDGTEIFSEISFTIMRGDHIGIVGPNGAGKSTLARIVAGMDRYFSGNLSYGYRVKAVYFAQHQAEELDPALTVYQTVQQVYRGDDTRILRNILGAFLFRGDDVDKRVSVLSGGEKSRLALARMLVDPGNLLIMDEPTNHLDILSKEVLRDALARFRGTFVIVSHDRAFVRNVLNKVWELRNGILREHLGGIDSYIAATTDRSGIGPAEKPGKRQRNRAKERRRAAARERALLRKKTAPLQAEIDTLETSIDSLEQEKEHLEKKLAEPAIYQRSDESRVTNLRYREVQGRLETLYQEWEAAQNRLEELRRSLSMGKKIWRGS